MEDLLYQTFKTKEELKTTVIAESRKYDFVASIKDSHKEPGINFHQINFQCNFSGDPKKRKRYSDRCNCNWKLEAKWRESENQFQIVDVSQHNGHRITPAKTKSFHNADQVLPESASMEKRAFIQAHFNNIKASYNILLQCVREEHSIVGTESTKKTEEKKEPSAPTPEKEKMVEENNIVDSTVPELRPWKYLRGPLFGLQGTVQSVVDVGTDGNCGYRALALLREYGQDNYQWVKEDMLAALNRLPSPYNTTDGRDFLEREKLRITLSQPRGSVEKKYWLDDVGLQLAADTYYCPLIIMTEERNILYVPLCRQVSNCNTRPMIIRLLERHYNVVYIAEYHPAFDPSHRLLISEWYIVMKRSSRNLLAYFDEAWKEVFPEFFNNSYKKLDMK